MYDIDNFKYVNDTYGHDIGDQVLKSLSNEIKKTIRKTDLLFRIGGEEFIIIYPKTDIQKGYIATKKVLESTKNITLLKDQAITISIGLTQVQDEDTVDTIFKRVDNYLYTSKNSGKNMITTDDVVKI